MEGLPPTNISTIKNKQRRSEAYKKLKQEKRKTKLEERKRREEERKLLGEDAVPKQLPRTIENTRVHDDTMVDPLDEEVMLDEEADEWSGYFNREKTPKILITTTDRPNSRTNKFCKELKKSIPNSYVYYRRGLALKKIIPQAVSKEFTDLIVINEDQKEPNGMVICHLPDGPTAHFRLSSVRFCKEIKRSGALESDYKPELILNNFSTRVGHSVGRMLAALYPHDPQFTGRRVVTFHNQRDYIFFRQHRYQFRNDKKVSKQELGPRFTLRLRSLQKGTFDSLHGEYEFIDQPREMAKSRRKFVL